MPAGWIAAAVAGSAVIGAVASNSAAGKQEAAANNATALQDKIYNETVGRNQPFVTAGTGAVNTLADELGTSGNSGVAGYGSLTKGFTPADYLANQDPGYQFQLQTGENAIQSRAAATGSAIGGAALKDLNNFAQGTAATGYQSAFDRYQTQNSNVYARLAGLAGIGQASANNSAAAGTSFGQSAGSNMIGAGNAAAAGTIGASNALTSGANNAAGYYYLNSLNGSGAGSALISSKYSGGYGATGGGAVDFISG
jgi:hypothetical protein